jgi:hypothetical protein
MSQVQALEKYPCPKCGGDAEWSAAKQALVCPYCGETFAYTPAVAQAGAGVRENPLEEALASLEQGEHGWGEAKVTVACQSCRAISVFDPQRVAQRCDFCGSPSIVPQQAMNDAVKPESLLPAAIAEPQIRDALRQWYGSRWFAPNKLKKAAMTDTLHGIYLPYWTFDAHVAAQWSADAGHHYYTTERVRGSDGKMTDRQVQHTRWVPASGSLQHFFDDELVPATVGVHEALLKGIEPFPTKDLKPYDPAYVRGWTVERYQLDLRKAAEKNIGEMQEQVRALCAQQVPGDTHRNLQVRTRFQGRTFKHILVPVCLVTYNYGAKSFQVVVNGYTGKIAGERPYSWVKIFFLVMFILFVLLIFVSLGGGEG